MLTLSVQFQICHLCPRIRDRNKSYKSYNRGQSALHCPGGREGMGGRGAGPDMTLGVLTALISAMKEGGTTPLGEGH
jgi:hypothetical protein